jgi:hypothetical protein
MNKLLFLAILFATKGFSLLAQPVAPDFTATDCNAVSHNLYTELDAGKIIVLVWVEPCGGCISDAKAAYDAAMSFGSTNPGRVLYWMADDLGNTNCAALAAWASANGIIYMNITTFENVGNSINEADFGGYGMPHVVVIGGGTAHNIFYNQLSGSYDGPAITGGIIQALNPSLVSNLIEPASMKLYPNPANDQVTVNYYLDHDSPVSVEVFNTVGALVKSTSPINQAVGQNSIKVVFENKLSRGIYFLRLRAGDTFQTIKFNVAN